MKKLWDAINGYKTYMGVAVLIVGGAAGILNSRFPELKITSDEVQFGAMVVAMVGAAVAAVGAGHKAVKKVAKNKAAKNGGTK